MWLTRSASKPFVCKQVFVCVMGYLCDCSLLDECCCVCSFTSPLFSDSLERISLTEYRNWLKARWLVSKLFGLRLYEQFLASCCVLKQCTLFRHVPSLSRHAQYLYCKRLSLLLPVWSWVSSRTKSRLHVFSGVLTNVYDNFTYKLFGSSDYQQPSLL